jgi:hypothetical protein
MQSTPKFPEVIRTTLGLIYAKIRNVPPISSHPLLFNGANSMWQLNSLCNFSLAFRSSHCNTVCHQYSHSTFFRYCEITFHSHPAVSVTLNDWCALSVITESSPCFPVFVRTSCLIVSWVLSLTRRDSVQGAIKLLSKYLKVCCWLACVLRPVLLLRCHPEATRAYELKCVIILHTALKAVKIATEIFYCSLPTAVISANNPSINSINSYITRKMFWT